jgi:hypothetical protein
MLRWKLGDTAFFRGIRSYLNDPKLSYGFALTDDLIRNMENASGKDLRPFFRDWVFGQGYPSYKATCIQNANNWIKIRLAQTTSHISVPFFAMPVELRLKGKSGEMRTTLEHATNDQEFWIDPGFAVDSVFIDPDLWILTNNKSATVSRSDAGINEIRLFPNPATNTAYVQISNPTDRLYEITLFNMIGQILYKTQRNAAGNDEMIQLPLRNHPKGMYLVKVSANGTERMVKKLLIR